MNTLSPDIKQAVEEKAQELVREKGGILQQKVLAVSGLLFSTVVLLVGGASVVTSPEDTRPGSITIGMLGLALTQCLVLRCSKLFPV